MLPVQSNNVVHFTQIQGGEGKQRLHMYGLSPSTQSIPKVIDEVSGTRGQLPLLVRRIALKLLSHHIFSTHTQLPAPWPSCQYNQQMNEHSQVLQRLSTAPRSLMACMHASVPFQQLFMLIQVICINHHVSFVLLFRVTMLITFQSPS